MTDRSYRFKKTGLCRGPIEVRPSSIHRYGVFATGDIPAGAIIEECPLLSFPADSYPDAAMNYVFQSSENGDMVILLLGYGSLYNHSGENNADYFYDETNALVYFESTRPIVAGEEICISYSDDWFQSRKIPAQ